MKKLLSIIAITVLIFAVKAQTPYYYYSYRGEKVYLSLNTEYAFISVKDRQMPEDILQRNIKAGELMSDQPHQESNNVNREMQRYYTTLRFDGKMPDEQYLSFLSDLKLQNRGAIISPFFKLYEGDVTGLSNFFYVKLKESGDTALLRQMTLKTHTVIIEQDTFMPLWYVLSTTEASELNAVAAI